MRGEAVMGRMLSRLDLQTLLLLYHSGWDIERVFRLCVSSLNHVVNRPATAREGADASKSVDSFHALMHLLQDLQRDGEIDIGYAPGGESASAFISLPTNTASPDTAELRSRLNLAAERAEYRLVLGTRAEANDPGAIVVGSRSLMGILFFLSHAVEVPATDEESAVVSVARDSAGKPVNWGDANAGLFRIRVSTTPPPISTIRTFYREHWFYIDDSDLESKSTMMLLSQLVSMQSGPANSFAPVLTLPTGGTP
jgi:hypothetical protein